MERKRRFSDPSIERVYLSHNISEKRKANFPSFLLAMGLTSFFHFLTHCLHWAGLDFHSEALKLISSEEIKMAGEKNSLFVSAVILVEILGFLGVVLMLLNKNLTKSSLCPPVAVLTWTGMILLPLALRPGSLPLRSGLGWVMLESFLVFVALPVRFEFACFYGTCISLGHTLLLGWKGRRQPLLLNQLLANILLLAASNCLGVMAFYFNDKRQRLSFLDTRQSLEVKETMEAAGKEQKRLLFSVLPRHLADQMAKDMAAESAGGGGDGGAFKKIYMNRHEPVSILFADIVGFTAMSAAIGSAAKLVEILNDLFSTFDSLSDKHKQTRIKILGDCYYCVCGAPEENPDHASFSVYMGLAVVEAIKEIQRRTNSAVDMRVGIHTGAVLAGVLGQRQWQYDVYSEDVTLANKMESSGMPGRVHISDRTLNFLRGEFEVEPSDGDQQEEKLRMAGIKTFFITKVLKPYVGDSEIVETGKTKAKGKDDYGGRLEAHLELQDNTFLKETNKLTLHFNNKEKEREFTQEEDASSGPSFFGLAGAVAASAGASGLVISFHVPGFTAGSGAVLLIALIGSWIITKRTAILEKLAVRSALAIICVFVAAITNLAYLAPCFSAGTVKTRNATALVTRKAVEKDWTSLSCYYPAYFSPFVALTLFGLSIMSNTASWIKIIASAIITVMTVATINAESIRKALAYSEIFSFPKGFDLIAESGQTAIFIVAVFALLCLLNRALEISSRGLFLQKYDVIHLREQAVAMRERNEALMCNIMPQHVAEHFLDKTQNHDQLYSHNYHEVGIVFASMPNFADFYTEDAVNNQGLECLRFLNEVISDYDAILDNPQYKDKIIKIKTIGSTYMGASGLNPHIQVQPGVSMRERWRHLSLLVEFVLEMKKQLDRINKESYNQFVLRIGLNHGPVTAGVIGATKPAYDTWGNTVNVASRMESTGKAGWIQVTDECYRILRMYGYEFEKRGFVAVKGKGQLLTYFLVGRGKGELTDEEIEELEKKDLESNDLPPADG